MLTVVDTRESLGGNGGLTGHAAAQALRVLTRADACVHCGLCLASCPTYQLLGDENDSPRGRIVLIRDLVRGEMSGSDRTGTASAGRAEVPTSLVTHLDRCLDCRSCETSCPSGVQYGYLVETARNLLADRLADGRSRRWGSGLIRLFLEAVLAHPERLGWAVGLAQGIQRLGLDRLVTRTALLRVLPAGVQKALTTLPRLAWPPEPLSLYYPARGPERGCVGLFTGCAAEAMTPEASRSTIAVLTANGFSVVVPPEQDCCGAIAHHNDDEAGARTLALRNMAAFERFLDAPAVSGERCIAVISHIAGCGAMKRSYRELFEEDGGPLADRAARFADRVEDVSAFLWRQGLRPPTHRLVMKACYHDACHLAHGQQVRSQPRGLLGRVSGLELAPLPDSDLCCGAAGSYNLTQPELAGELTRRKLQAIQSTGARHVILGNIGCHLQISSFAGLSGMDLQVHHTMDVLAAGYGAGPLASMAEPLDAVQRAG